MAGAIKGIILAGGSGTRLRPLTVAISKQLLPVYDKPMIYYPLTTLMLAGIKEILVITTPGDQAQFFRLLGHGSQWGIRISYAIQAEPRGLAEALIIGENFTEDGPAALILGDNIFYGQGLGRSLSNITLSRNEAMVFIKEVPNPSQFGVVTLNKNREVEKIEEKPTRPQGNLVATGLYFFGPGAATRAKKLAPSKRGELEIADLLSTYLRSGKLLSHDMGLGTAWFDTGTFEGLFEAASFIRSLERTQGVTIGSPEDISRRLGMKIDF